jgi:hypothetical protein
VSAARPGSHQISPARNLRAIIEGLHSLPLWPANLTARGYEERSMTVTVRRNTPLVVPPSIQRQAGLTVGEQVEFRASGGVITITPPLPTADDEYTHRTAPRY